MLVLDEPTASLDYGNTVRVLSRIKALADKGYGIIMTTHNPDQAFLMSSKVALLMRNAPVIFGDAVDVITKKNLHDAYGVDVGIIEFVNDHGSVQRVCAPSF
jgi:iron complex transport system ATP-binding protein